MRARTIAAISAAVALGGGMAVFGPAVAATAKSPNLQNLSNELNKAKHVTYYAQYKNVSGGQTTTITVAQAPPKSLFSSSDGSLAVNTGKATYYCSASSGNSGSTGNSGSGNSGSGNSGNTGGSTATATTTKPKSSEQCYSEKGANPLLGTEALFSGAALTGVFAQAEESAIARALGIHVSSSSANYGGQSATCVTVTRKGRGAKYCVTSQGILAYESTGKSDYFELTKYSSHPPSSVFELPAGATSVTIPSLPGGSPP